MMPGKTPHHIVPRQISAGLWRRLALIPGKVRQKGLKWMLMRTIQVTGLNRHWIPFWHRVFSRAGFNDYNKYVLNVYYDLDLYPVSYDVAYFLVAADIERRRLGLSKMHVIFARFSAEEYGDYDAGTNSVVDTHSRDWRFRNLAVAIPALLPATTGVTVCVNRAQAKECLARSYHLFPSTDSSPWRREDLPAIYRQVVGGLRLTDGNGLHAPQQALRYVQQWIDRHAAGRRLVVITLRQYQVDPDRNSNLEAWIAFARSLDTAVYAAVFIPDTDHVFDRSREALDEFLVFEPAAWNVELRMAIYERAYMNLMVNTGTGMLCALNARCSYIMFKLLVPNVHLASETTIRNQGFVPGENPRFALPHQKWVWEADSFDIIRREFDQMRAALDARTYQQPSS
ncbi:MAG: hypothetical protein ACK4NA_15450 [Alphaproteobacteria bacterium]